MQALMQWMSRTSLADAMLNNGWAWPLAEAVHFMGLVLLAGTVGLFDLRVLGWGKGVAPATVHRLLPFGLLGFALSLVTGVMFIFATPDQYFYNSAFHWKVVFLGLMGTNALFFYLLANGDVRQMSAGADAPRGAKISAAISLATLVAVMYCGRMLTFFRPPGGF